MIAVSLTEFRDHMRKYLDLAKKERVIINGKGDETFEVLSRERISDSDLYFSNAGVAEHLEKSMRSEKEGRVRKTSAKELLEKLK
jgi:PHD/YefM family antitoxin component YafN of YafNO toxin-antitoxin module